jgi:beta-galactosidase
MGFGSRGMASHSHPAYRAACARIAGALAERYGDHPAVVLWHVHNEYGVPAGEDYSPRTAAVWREWLAAKYGSLADLNAAWGTAFWGQHYGEWSHVDVPAIAPSVVNPAQRLDFARFTDAQLRECYLLERDAIRAHASQPITTNFMAAQSYNSDLWKWSEIVDVVSNDHYLTAADPDGHIGLSLSADLTRSLARGRPWILMEHSTSAVNWQPRNIAKRPGEMARNSLSHVARGADAVLFFQWRASRSGAEKFHSAMLPHSGTSSRGWREVVDLGHSVGQLAELQGSTVRADAAILWDPESFWAQDLEWHPSEDVKHREQVRAYYERLWRDGITTDFVGPTSDFAGYRMVVVPSGYLLSAQTASKLTTFAQQGGVVVVSYFAAAVDEHDAVHPGGYAAPLRELLGLVVEEYLPLREHHTTSLDWDGTAVPADMWQEDVVLHGAEAIATYVDGPAAGKPAVTRHSAGVGAGWYVSTRLDVAALAHVFAGAYADAGMSPSTHPEGLEVVTRANGTHEFVIAMNHRDDPVVLAIAGTDLLTGEDLSGEWQLGAGAVAVVRTEPTPQGGDG